MSTVPSRPNGAKPSEHDGESSSFDWPTCVRAFTSEHVAKLARWRGYSQEFARWLRQQGLIGLYQERVAFPLQDPETGDAFGCHYRMRDGTWRVLGGRMVPLAIGNVEDPELCLVGESQWDVFSVMDKMGWHKNEPPYGAIVTRGASNGRMISVWLPKGVEVIALPQNDEAGQRWLRDVIESAPGAVRIIRIPDKFKDANQWLSSDVSSEELHRRIFVDFERPSPIPLVTPSSHHAASTDESDEILDPGPFPIEALPPAARAMAVAASEAYQTAPELPAMASLATLSAAIGKAFFVTDAVPGRRTHLNLYIIAGAPKSYGKSSGADIVRPIVEASNDLAEDFRRNRLPSLKSRIATLEALKSGILKQIARPRSAETPAGDEMPPDLRTRLEKAEREIDEIKTELLDPSLWIGGATTEALAEMLRRNNGTIFSFSPEAGDLVRIALGRYRDKGKADFDLLLSGYTVEPFRETRIGRGDNMLVPCITCLWLCQPFLLKELYGHEEAQERGLTARVLSFICEHERIPHDDGQDRRIPDTTSAAWGKLVADIIRARRQGEHAIQCSPEAREVLRKWHNESVDMRNDAFRDVEGELGRWREHAIRIAGVLAVADGISEGRAPITLDARTAERAVTVARWAGLSSLRMLQLGRARRLAERMERLLAVLAEAGGQQTLRILEKHHGFLRPEIESLVTRYPEKFEVTTHKPATGRPGEVLNLKQSRSSLNA
ncbi:MAG TPA: DUF3987 domain-containing protein [Verrucomicrobiae bacterium]|nr:DUF3987 domain-containing protein [Verrucomicrobiae bacterium]